MTNPTAVYRLKGHKIKEHQLFVRTYYVDRELTTGTYVIDGGKAYYINTDNGKAVRCNFNASFLNTGYTKSIQPLDEFYEGVIGESSETEDADNESAE